MKTEVLVTGEIFIEGGILKHKADGTSDLFSLSQDIISIDICFATRRTEKRAKHIDGGGFTCPIWSQKTEYLALYYIERDTIYCNQLTELFRQVLDLCYIHYH
jgi:hypothetical protein